MEFTDRLLTCVECGKEFIFTAGEQLFFSDKQFKNDPKRCKPCKSKRYGGSAGKSSGGPAAAGISRTETRTHCSECGVETTVPFRPTQGRPVLCRACFQTKRPEALQTAGAAAVAELPPQLLGQHADEQHPTDAALPLAEAAAVLAEAAPSAVEPPLPAAILDTPTPADPPAEA